MEQCPVSNQSPSIRRYAEKHTGLVVNTEGSTDAGVQTEQLPSQNFWEHDVSVAGTNPKPPAQCEALPAAIGLKFSNQYTQAVSGGLSLCLLQSRWVPAVSIAQLRRQSRVLIIIS